jgi:hypothetical protein
MKRYKFILSTFLLGFFLSASSCNDNQPDFKPDKPKPQEPVDPPDNPGSTEDPDDTSPDPAGTFDYSKLANAGHPRVLMTADDFSVIKRKVSGNSNPTLKTLNREIIRICDEEILTDNSKLTYVLDVSNLRLLPVAREALKRILFTAYAYRMTGKEEYLKKAEEDLNTVCNFPDWNHQKHFLDVGEMSLAVALGYDWLYNDLSLATRLKCRNKIIEYAFNPSLNANFHNQNSNWNQICNAGVVAGALALYEKSKSASAQIIEKALQSNSRAMAAIYSPDGNYPEGYGYWGYGTEFQVFMIAALEKIFGHDGGLSDTRGFSKTAEYMLFMAGLDNQVFNYSDCASPEYPKLAMWWFADKYKNPSLLANEIRVLDAGKYINNNEDIRMLPIIMPWVNNVNDVSNIQLPSQKIWSGGGEMPVVMVHTNWMRNDDDRYLGIKAGKANYSHGHMDAGSFVYDALGYRWAADLGLQSYTAVENALAGQGGRLSDMSQNSLRWDVFRLRNHNHNTITINDRRHQVNGEATITRVIETGNELGAELDLSAVVSDQVVSAKRTVKLVDEKDLFVIDEIQNYNYSDAVVKWTLVTRATVSLDQPGNIITLTRSNKTMYVKISVSDASITPVLQKWPNNPANSYESTNTGITVTGFEATIAPGKSGTITVQMTPEK